jgi:E3 Ubiquitin ligase
MPNSLSFWFVLACLAGTAIGPVLFFKGFRMLRFKRMILNTPLSRIHSASIGLVEVTGMPVGPHVLSAPVTGDACYYYRVRAWQWVEDGNNHYWKSALDESLYVPFFLEDSTGRVLIDPQGADLDVHKSFSDEISASLFRSSDFIPANIRDFLLKRALVPYEKIKVEESIIPQGFPLFVFGTLGEVPALNQRPSEGQVTASAKISSTSPSGSPSSVGFSLHSHFSANVPARIASTAVEVLNRIPGVHGETSEFEIPNTAAPAEIPEHSAASSNRASTPLAVNVLPASATASSAKSAFGEFDPHPSVAISKGERNEPFAISGHSQRELIGKLAWKSALFIWGGPVLGIACFYCLLTYWEFVSR